MARSDKRNGDLKPKHLNPDNIIFSIFSTEELRKLCVTKIFTPITFDSLGHPLAGGLYDTSLGPISDRSDPCSTCFKNLYGCPGHFGYIELPLPVINPLFHKTISSLLRITCLSCFYVQIPMHIKHCLAIQIKLLKCGLVAEAIEIENRISELISKYSSFDNIPEDTIVSVKEFEVLADTAFEECGGKITINKNTETLRNQFIGAMLRNVKPRKKCLHCKEPLDKISTLRNKIILTTRTRLDKKNTSLNASFIKGMQSKHLNPDECRKYIRELWENEKELLLQLIPVLNDVTCENPTDILFFEIIPVTPANVRPVNMVKGRITEHEQTGPYKSLLLDGLLLRVIIQVVQAGNTDTLQIEARNHYNLSRGTTAIEKLNYAYEDLQTNVNSLMDKDEKLVKKGTGGNEQGLKQIIEKKAGIIRMHMMGKRVNFAARSVITPDPNLNIDEIGIPEAFAKHLTYPVPVTTWNVEELRKMIKNGPNVHPGAVSVEFEAGYTQRIDESNKESILKRLLTPDTIHNDFRGVKKVYRHLCNGDIMLLNRQPTLHKPSIMAHTARILKGEKTLRLHYANCKAYNADFDGDEMNAHFPQNELARSEGYLLANVSNQYLVPKDGTPLSGLIQDHMISGVRLSVRGKFFSKYDYQQLVFQALALKTSDIKLLPPAIVKPQQLWSGKQILSTVIINIIPAKREPINLTATSKIPAKAWLNCEPRPWKGGGTPLTDSNSMSEAEVIIRQGQLLVGVLDKTHYGATPYGLIHCMYELYGGTYAIKLLSALAKLFMRFLQREGFTLGVHDILCLSSADKTRRKIVKSLRKIGTSTITQALNIAEDASTEEILDKIEEQSATNAKIRNIIDRQYKSSLDSYTNDINKACLPAGLICKFPQNNLQLMVQSGAKGSTVNTMQISCLLGQIELEGKRPPVMISGKSLPSFPVFEFAPRAGGFIDGRFMTGIQPQEFFFHCMAGREGLIDTAVKTSRSGYLQRCLIKHLEGLSVGYDLTVRDSDMSVIQFYYGEDGMDISKAQFLNSEQLPFLVENSKAIYDKTVVQSLKEVEGFADMEEHNHKFSAWKETNGNPLTKKKNLAPFTKFSDNIKDKIGNKSLKVSEKTGRDKKTKFVTELWREASDDIKNTFIQDTCPAPTVSKFLPHSYFGAMNERLSGLVDDYKAKVGGGKAKKVENMMKLKAMQSLCDPGEPVGLLAAQSIGEPSTQMTLNTFHFAGRGEMNVTLGIPRLREILMMASKNLKTPSMEIPFLDVPKLEAKAEKLRKILTKVLVSDVLEKIDVTRELVVSPVRQHKIVLRFQFMPEELYKNDFYVKPKKIIKYMGEKFFKLMFAAIRKYAKINTNMVDSKEKEQKLRAENSQADEYDPNDTLARDGRMSPSAANAGNDDDSGSSDDEPEDGEDAKLASRFQEVHDDQEAGAEEKKDQTALDMSDNEDDDLRAEKEDAEAEKQEAEEDEIEAIRASVVDKHHMADNYTFDTKNHMWCELTFGMPLNYKKIDLTAILKEVAAKAVLHETPDIRRAITYMKDGRLTLRTDGINIVKMFEHRKLLDLNRLYSNDIHKVADTYGIEAAMKVIVKEVQDVFKVYGITVDPRHLLLIADYMTFNGSFEPLSRKGMENSASPLQQMSFESSLTFLKQAAIRGKHDKLQNPSSCLMVGKPCNSGTGSFKLLQKLPSLKS